MKTKILKLELVKCCRTFIEKTINKTPNQTEGIEIKHLYRSAIPQQVCEIQLLHETA